MIAEFGTDGLIVTARVGSLSFRVFPHVAKPDKAEKKAQRKAQKEKAAKDKTGKKTGGLKQFREMIPAIKKMLDRLRRRLLIKKLILYYISAGDDAAKTAISFGAANALLELIVPLLDRNLRIKDRDLRAFADFQAEKPTIYANANVSIAVWEAVYIVSAIVPSLLRLLRRMKT